MSDPPASIHEFDVSLICAYFAALERQGPGSPAVTVQALDFVDNLSAASRIADIGCGTGGQTMVLAAHTPARITGIDLFPDFIDRFNANSRTHGVHDRVTGRVGSMDDLPFAEAELDLIWSEGAIYNIGFARGINEWRRFLKPGGFLAVSEASWFTRERPEEIDRYWRAAYPEIDLVSTKVGQLEQAGYVPVAAFVLPETCWSDHFYAPQAAAREQFLRRHAGSRAAAELVANERHETELYKKYKQFYGYAFSIGRKM